MCSPVFVYISASRARSASLCNRTKSRKIAREWPDRRAQGNRLDDSDDFPRRCVTSVSHSYICGNWARLNLVKVEATLGLCNFHESIFIFLKPRQQRFKEKYICIYVRCTFRLSLQVIEAFLHFSLLTSILFYFFFKSCTFLYLKELSYT